MPLPSAAQPTVIARSPRGVPAEQEAGVLLVPKNGTQRVSSRSVRRTVIALATALVALTGAAHPDPAAAAGMKVVVIVGPVGSSTANYKDNARRYATQARSYGASVTEIYSQNATWSRVKAAAQGANVIIYLGHGNGSPSPYGAFSKYTKDGFGLNRTAGAGNYNTKYYGEYYVYSQIHLAPNAVVILNRLCYASGNSEWGMANPTKSTAIRRVDNFGAGFLRANARAVFAEAITSVSYTIRALFTSTRTMDAIFMNHPSASGARDFWFSSVRTPGYRAHLDPPLAGKYWRSVIGTLTMTATTFRAG